MNGNSVVADTNTLIYVLEGNAIVNAILFKKTVLISFVTEIELLSRPALTKEEVQFIRKVISTCEVMLINDAIKEQTIAIRQNFRMKTPDAIIAATAAVLEVPLVTADTSFARLQHPDIVLFSLDPIAFSKTPAFCISIPTEPHRLAANSECETLDQQVGPNFVMLPPLHAQPFFRKPHDFVGQREG